jgi:UDP-N-acetylmuramoylalanine--D-glutamate ligase
VESTRAALLANPGRVILIAGGKDKGAPFAEIENLVMERVKCAVLYGQAREIIASSWKNFNRVHKKADFRQAVRTAFEKSTAGDLILLSPMCTSFDQFSSFEQRGEAFKQVFQDLTNEKK